MGTNFITYLSNPRMTFETEYKTDNVAVEPVAADKIDGTFRSSTIDLVSAALGGNVLSFSDEWFAEASNLLTPTPPIRQPGKMVYSGAWYDGWETRRHNTAPFDYVVKPSLLKVSLAPTMKKSLAGKERRGSGKLFADFKNA